MKEIKEIRKMGGSLVGLEITETLTRAELERHYPRKEYRKQWELLDKQLPAEIL